MIVKLNFLCLNIRRQETNKYLFKEKPSTEELDLKVMEMFEFKENYDRERNI
ncbi:hypothetical protein FUSO4_03360 [Fusobacterium necrophorum DJ-1]|nr:hypothetical protein FUSO5_12265 [Fusobacterium necrophorum BFTR-1]KDE67178.1 hypothetical protein FUSO4_03360 [Fusobacterium necrophorum DJ-1]MBR8824052.1 hypothetical protein [Fusobacterium necrophorum]